LSLVGGTHVSGMPRPTGGLKGADERRPFAVETCRSAERRGGPSRAPQTLAEQCVGGKRVSGMQSLAGGTKARASLSGMAVFGRSQDQRLRVAVLASHLFPNYKASGAGPWLVTQLRELTKWCAPTVVLPHPWVPPALGGLRPRWAAWAGLPRMEVVGGIRVLHPLRVVVPGVDSWVLRTLSVTGSDWWCLRNALASRRFDVLHAHYAVPDGFAAVWLGRRYAIPSVVTVHGSDVHTLPRKSPRLNAVIRWTLRNADLVIAVSEELAELCRGLGATRERLRVFPMGVALDRFQQVDRTAAKAELGLPGRWVVCVGGLIPRKRPLLALHAFAALAPKVPDLRLAFVGDGPLRARLESECRDLGLEDRVLFTGVVPHDRVSLWLNAADVLVLSSAHEGLPTVILEALACGTPVVTTAVEGVREVLGWDPADAQRGAVWFGKWGAIVWADAPQDVALGLEGALARTWDRKPLRRRAEAFSASAMAARLYDKYLALCGRRLPGKRQAV